MVTPLCCIFGHRYGHVGLVPSWKVPLEKIWLQHYINTAKLLPMARYLFSLESFLWYVFTLTSCPPRAQRTFYYLPFYQLLCSSLLSIGRQYVLLCVHFSRQSLCSALQSLCWWHILRVFSPGSFPVGSTIPFRHRAEGLCTLLLWLNQLASLLVCMSAADLVLLCPASPWPLECFFIPLSFFLLSIMALHICLLSHHLLISVSQFLFPLA